MKKLLCCLTAAGAALAAAPAGYAQTQTTTTYFVLQPVPWYAHIEAGGTLMQDLTIKNAGGAKNGMDPGFRTTFSVGANFAPFFAAEVEAGALGNSFDTSASQPLSAIATHADIFQFPILANLIFKAPLKGGVTPYIGAGAGGVASTLYLHAPGFWARDTDFTFAYQAMAGVKFALNRNMEVGVGYKFLGTGDHSWFSDDPNLFVRSGHAYTHSILATFTWTF